MLAALKDATAAVHARVEAAMPSLAEMATPAGYAAALRALHGFHAAWEPAIWAALSGADATALAAHSARKLPLLAADLGALGVTPADLRAPGADALRGDPAGALGALYVLEGASLGGRVILRHVAGPAGMAPGRGASYFHGYGGETGSHWKAFGQALERAARAHPAADVIAGAEACFGALERWLATPGVVHPELASTR